MVMRLGCPSVIGFSWKLISLRLNSVEYEIDMWAGLMKLRVA